MENFTIKEIKFEDRNDYEDEFIKKRQNYDKLKDEKRLNASNVVNLLVDFTKIVYKKYNIDGKTEYKFFIRQFDKTIYQPLTKSLLSFYIVMIDKSINIEGCDASKLYKPVLKQLISLADNNKIDELNQPPTHLFLLKNGLYNLKSKQFFNKNDEIYNETISKYHYTDKPVHTYIPPENRDKKNYNSYQNLIDYLSNNDDILKQNLKQIMFATIEGYGRHKYLFFAWKRISKQSLFGELLSLLAGQTNFMIANLNDIKFSNYILKDPHLILCDYIYKNTRLSNKVINHFDMINKYNSVYIQIITEKPKFYEKFKNDIILVNFDYNKSNFKYSKNNFKYNLNENNNFWNEVVSEIINTVDYFEEFNI